MLTLTHRIQVHHIIALSIAQGLISAFDIPARQAFLVEIVRDRSDLGNAVALNSILFNGARLMGPSIAGFVIAWRGEGICFLIAVVFASQLPRLRAVIRPIYVKMGIIPVFPSPLEG